MGDFQDVRFGVRLPNSGPFAEAENVLALADDAQAHGYDRLWVHDHISWPQEKLEHFATGSVEACRDQDPNFYESVTTSALLLGRLDRIAVGIAGLVLPLRDPRVLAKQLTAIDRLSGGRLLVAVGIGAIRGDFEVMGVPWERRGRLTTDYLTALRAILAGEMPLSFESSSISFRDGTFLPRPQRLPLWVTGGSEAALSRAAALGDGWMTVYISVAEYREHVERLHALADAAGRDPASMGLGYETYVCVGQTHEDAMRIARRTLEEKFGLERGPEVCVVGSAAEVAERLAGYIAAGARELELKFIAHDVGQLREMVGRFADTAVTRAA